MKTLPINITEEQRDNLKKLADYLLSGNLKAKFDMEWYTDQFGSCAEGSLTKCGTVGCAAGHGPHAGIPKDNYESWGEYTHRQFGAANTLSSFSYIGEWAFSDYWYVIDNTSEGAAKRILWMLENNGIPENYEDQMDGEAPLCYVNPSGSTKTLYT